MRRVLGLTCAVAAACLALAGPAADAAVTTQSRVCPFPVVGGDPDSVSLTGPTATPVAGQPVTYTVTADESPGEASHVVYLRVGVSSPDGQSSTDPAPGVNAGFSPTVVTLTLDQGHHYTIDWTADFDFGIHPCSSAAPGQSPFELDT